MRGLSLLVLASVLVAGSSFADRSENVTLFARKISLKSPQTRYLVSDFNRRCSNEVSQIRDRLDANDQNLSVRKYVREEMNQTSGSHRGRSVQKSTRYATFTCVAEIQSDSNFEIRRQVVKRTGLTRDEMKNACTADYESANSRSNVFKVALEASDPWYGSPRCSVTFYAVLKK